MCDLTPVPEPDELSDDPMAGLREGFAELRRLCDELVAGRRDAGLDMREFAITQQE